MCDFGGMVDHPPGGVSPSHQDYALIKRLESAIFRQTGGYDHFRRDFPQLLRLGIDEVIDAPRTNRFTISEIEKTEKTYLGTKVEILLRKFLKSQKGKILDLLIDGIEVDVKNTIGSNWTIPPEAIGHPCILIRCNEIRALCAFGILIVRGEALNAGSNRDGKRTVSSQGLASVYWLLKDEPYPQNFWERLNPTTRMEIMAPGGGKERLAILFRHMQRTPVSRLLVQAVAQQDDYMKRIRRNGGARDILAPVGIAILWGQKDKALIEALKLPTCGPDEFISVKPETESHKALLRDAGHID